jgi:hypothetical protein
MHALAFLSARTRVAVLRLIFRWMAASLIARCPRSAFQRRRNVWKHIGQLEIVATSGNKFANWKLPQCMETNLPSGNCDFIRRFPSVPLHGGLLSLYPFNILPGRPQGEVFCGKF